MWTADFWKDLVERLLWTFVEAFIGALLIIAIADVDLDALEAAGAAGIAAVLSALKSTAAAQIKKSTGKDKPKQTAQLGTSTYTYA